VYLSDTSLQANFHYLLMSIGIRAISSTGRYFARQLGQISENAGGEIVRSLPKSRMPQVGRRLLSKPEAN
jgi:hypothetical protein